MTLTRFKLKTLFDPLKSRVKKAKKIKIKQNGLVELTINETEEKRPEDCEEKTGQNALNRSKTCIRKETGNSNLSSTDSQDFESLLSQPQWLNVDGKGEFAEQSSLVSLIVACASLKCSWCFTST
jgi:hypothetical protein